MNTIYGYEAYNMSFCDVWDTATKFVNDYKASGLYLANNKISDDSARALYYLLYANFGNSTIASNDPNRFKYKVFQLIFSYGPTWERQLALQKSIRELTDEQLQSGSTLILNHAYNPSSAPSTQTTTELTYINEQNVNKNKKSLVEGYAILQQLLDTDVTASFINKFRTLFKQIVQPDVPIVFYDDPYYPIDAREVNGFDYGWQD